LVDIMIVAIKLVDIMIVAIKLVTIIKIANNLTHAILETQLTTSEHKSQHHFWITIWLTTTLEVMQISYQNLSVKCQMFYSHITQNVNYYQYFL
jgi:hypothetical protein